MSTANRLVLTLQRLYTFTTIRVKVLKNFEPSHAYVLIRHNTTLSRCDCIGTLRGLYKKSLYLRTGPLLSAVPQKTKLPSPAPQSSITQKSTNQMPQARYIYYLI